MVYTIPLVVVPTTSSVAAGLDVPIPTFCPLVGFNNTYALLGDPFEVPFNVSVEAAPLPP